MRVFEVSLSIPGFDADAKPFSEWRYVEAESSTEAERKAVEQAATYYGIPAGLIWIVGSQIG